MLPHALGDLPIVVRTTDSGLRMTTVYTHPWPWVQRQQVEQALRQWPQSLALSSFDFFALRASCGVGYRVSTFSLCRHVEHA
jgi:hypothetical protein